jgi:hypothetical protein
MKPLHIHILRSARSIGPLQSSNLFKLLPQAKASFSSCPKLSRTVKGYMVVGEDQDDIMVTKAEKKKAQRFELKTPKGTKDCMDKV